MLIKPACWANFFRGDTFEWIIYNSKREIGKISSINRKLNFGEAVHRLWLRRNAYIFRNENCNTSNTFWSIILAARDFEESMGALAFSNSICREITIYWKPPEIGWIKGNVDGANREEGRAASCGVFRNSTGRWVAGFSRGLGSMDKFLAELWGIFTGIQLAWTKGFRRVCFEFDSRASVNLIANGCVVGHPLSQLISSINELRSKDWTVELRWCYRESNGAANWLASSALEMLLETRVLEDPPDGLKQILERDLDLKGFRRWA